MFRERGIEIKTPEQIALMRKAGLVVGETLELMRQTVKPGVTTGELDAIARQDEPDAPIGERDLEIAEASVDRRPIDAGHGRDFPPGQRPLRDEQQGLELGLRELGGHLGRLGRRWRADSVGI